MCGREEENVIANLKLRNFHSQFADLYSIVLLFRPCHAKSVQVVDTIVSNMCEVFPRHTLVDPKTQQIHRQSVFPLHSHSVVGRSERIDAPVDSLLTPMDCPRSRWLNEREKNFFNSSSVPTMTIVSNVLSNI